MNKPSLTTTQKQALAALSQDSGKSKSEILNDALEAYMGKANDKTTLRSRINYAISPLQGFVSIVCDNMNNEIAAVLDPLYCLTADRLYEIADEYEANGRIEK